MRGLETNMRGLDVHTRDAATHLSVREGRTATGHWAPPAHICAGTGLDPTSPHLHGHWAHPSHNGTAPDRRTSATCALRMVTMWHSNVCLQRMSPPPVVAFEASPWDSRAASPDLAAIVRPRPNHGCTGTGLAPATSAPGLGSPRRHWPQHWAHPCHICHRTGLAPATSAPGLGRLQPLATSAREGAGPHSVMRAFTQASNGPAALEALVQRGGGVQDAVRSSRRRLPPPPPKARTAARRAYQTLPIGPDSCQQCKRKLQLNRPLMGSASVCVFVSSIH
jgi:hypothetical protein